MANGIRPINFAISNNIIITVIIIGSCGGIITQPSMTIDGYRDLSSPGNLQSILAQQPYKPSPPPSFIYDK